MKLAAALLALIIALHGCVADDGLTGTGPVKLTERQQGHFEEWQEGRVDRDPLYFFLGWGGRSFYTYCPNTAASCRGTNEKSAHKACEARIGWGGCKLYGAYGDVVWKFNEKADPKWWNVFDRPNRPVVAK